MFDDDLYAAERVALDQEIIELIHKLCYLRSKRNRLAPISQLPPELLIRIFLFFQSGRVHDATYYQWTVITQVSSYWRMLILATPSLWAKIIQPRRSHNVSQWALASFDRSGTSPLKVHIRTIYLRTPVFGFLRSVLSEMHRIQTMEVGVHTGGVKPQELEFFKNCFEKPAPILREISLKSYSKGFFMSPELFCGKAPALRRLELCDIGLHWDELSIRNLTSLKLNTRDYVFKISFDNFLHILTRNEQLQELDVDSSVLLWSADESRLQREKIVLPFLRTLTLIFLSEALGELFTILSIPTHTKISISTIPELADDIDWKEFFGPFSRCFIAGPLHFGTIEVSLHASDDRCVIEFWEDPDPDSKQPPLISIEFPDANTLALTEAVQYFPVGEVRSLCMNHIPRNYVWQSPDFTFPPALTYLKLSGLFIGWFIGYLQENPTSLPTLEILELRLRWVRGRDMKAKLQELSPSLKVWRGCIGGKLKELKLFDLGELSQGLSEELACIDEFVDVRVVS